MIDEKLRLLHNSYCSRAETHVNIDLGDILVSGIPCVDFSTYGSRKGLSGPSGILILIWVRLILIHMPAFIILEEVKPFLKEGLPLLMQPDMLGSSYTFAFEFLDPRFFNLPVSRPRMYCILTRTCSWSLSRSLNDLRSTFPPFGPRLSYLWVGLFL